MLYVFFDVAVFDGLQALYNTDECHDDKYMYEAKLPPVYLSYENRGDSSHEHKQHKCPTCELMTACSLRSYPHNRAKDKCEHSRRKMY